MGGFLRDLLIPSRPLALAGWSGPLGKRLGRLGTYRRAPCGEASYERDGDRNWSAISALVCRRRQGGSYFWVPSQRRTTKRLMGREAGKDGPYGKGRGLPQALMGPFTEENDEEAYGQAGQEPGSLYRRKSLHKEKGWARQGPGSLTGMSASGRLCPYGKAGGTVLTGRARARRKMTESLCRKPRTGRDVHGKGRSSHERPGWA